ncbi:unnamed protein product [Orchesella dallaii]|uniref:Cyclic nucleotide-binding domain-containing protein n=1 Tax=Orchesella dallaii TaxID=48710 RepID=A0ABP1S330_9HEXA
MADDKKDKPIRSSTSQNATSPNAAPPPPPPNTVEETTPVPGSQEEFKKQRQRRTSYPASKKKSVESKKSLIWSRSSKDAPDSSFLARSNKVAPEPLATGSAPNSRRASISSSFPLTGLPYKSPVLGGIAVSKKSVTSIKEDDTKKYDKRQSTESRKSKDKDVYEMKMPRQSSIKGRPKSLDAQSAANERRRTSVTLVSPDTYAQINPRTLGSLVQSLKVIYGDHFEDVRRKHHRRRTQKSSRDHSPEKTEVPPLKHPELTEDTAELLHARLYGNQKEVLEKFLEGRKDCERELVFEEATFPRWLTYLWKVHLLYEFVTSCILLISVFYGTYAAIFRVHSTDIELLGMIDLFIGIDVIIRLLVELWRSLTKCQYEVFTVNYTFGLSLLDALALFPTGPTFMYFADANVLENLMLIPRLELVQCFHLFRMVRILDKLQEDVKGYAKFSLFLVRYIIHYLLLVHVLACLIFFTGKKTYLQWLLNMQPESNELKQYVTFLTIRSHLPEPPEKFYLPYPEPFGIYTLSLYLVVATVSTVGFGDFFPTTNIERILTIIMMMIGAIWISGELAYKLGTFFTDQDASRYMMFFRVNCIKIHLRNYHVSDFILKRTENYYKHLWRYRRGVHEIDLTYLPHCVQEEIKYDICEEMFYKSPMFRGLDETFLMGLAKDAKVSLFSPRMILFERGSITKKMCFILQGEVAVASDLSDDHISAIHRAGCLIGEINLFMSLPYEQTMYTRTVCTIMTITKRDLMLCLQDNPHIFSIMRERMRKRRERYRDAFNLQDSHPYVQWIYPKEQSGWKCDPEFPVSITNLKGWNKPVTGHPMEHIDEQVIIEMPCERQDLHRGVIEAYGLVSVPQIYYSPGLFLTAFNIGTLSLWFYLTWLTPVCATYDNFKNSYFGACLAISRRWDLIIFVCIVDLIVELLTACPSSGRYFKLRDGLIVRKSSFGFYCDLLSIFPLELMGYGWSFSLIRMCLKFWKVSRFWEFLDERFALRLFYIRIAKMTYYLLYLSFIVALFFLNLVCEPGREGECAEISFYNPIYPQKRWERIKTGHHLEQYILSTPIVFAVSTITSVGFGNVAAQTTKEILWTTFFMIVGHFFVSYILAQLTSALSARLTPQLIFHQKLLVVETFIRHNGLSTSLLRKLIEHYDLQHQYVSGCALPEGTHLMYDGHRFVVPPDLVFVQRGEVRRELYVIVNGSVALYQHGEKSASAILRSTGHFGLRDLLFGEPYPYRVKTLSYVVLYSVDYSVFQEVLGDDEGLMEYIKDELKRREDEISNYQNVRVVDEDGPSEREVVSPSWLTYPGDPDIPTIGGDLTYDHFERPFLYHKGSDFIR